jgi:hypothetical protein
LLQYEECPEYFAQVSLVKHDQVAKSFATHGSDNSLNVDVSRREWCGRRQTKPAHLTARTAF